MCICLCGMCMCVVCVCVCGVCVYVCGTNTLAASLLRLTEVVLASPSLPPLSLPPPPHGYRYCAHIEGMWGVHTMHEVHVQHVLHQLLYVYMY